MKLSYWETIDYYNIKKEAISIHDKWCEWHNYNDNRKIEYLLKNKNYTLLGQLGYYLKYIMKEDNYSKKIIDIKHFELSLHKNIIIYRGGEGKYKKDFLYTRNWLSFTASENRAYTFSQYQGTFAQKVYSLPENEHYWIVKLVIPLKNILLYYDVNDDEIIIDRKEAVKAELILQE